MLLVAPRVFRAPEGPAAREARRPHFVRRRASKPARALRTLRRPPHRRCLWFWCARPGPAAAHQHRGQARRSLRRPPHRRRLLLIGGAVPRPSMLSPTPNLARNSLATLSNIEFRSLELQRFQTLLKLHSIELRARFRGSMSLPAQQFRMQFPRMCFMV